MKALIRGEETDEYKIPRVLVIVRGGVAEIIADETANVFVVDYDNEPEAVIPNKYNDLLRE